MSEHTENSTVVKITEEPEKLASEFIKEGEYDGPPKPKALFMVAFLMLGITSLVSWNVIIQTMEIIDIVFLGKLNVNNAIMAASQISSLLSQIYLLTLNKPRPNYIKAGAIVSIIFSVVFAPALRFVESVPARATFAVILNILCGICLGIMQGQGFAIASMFAKNYVPAVSTGQGLAGLLSFIVCTGAAYIFNIESVIGGTFYLVVSNALVTICSVIYLVLHFVVMRDPHVKAMLARACAKADADAGGKNEFGRGTTEVTECIEMADKKVEVVSKKIGQEQFDQTCVRSPIRILIDYRREFLLSGFHFFLCLNMFPRMGPISWDYDSNKTLKIQALLGLFSLMEAFGRSLPSFASIKHLGFLFVSKRVYPFLVLGRMLFYIPFVLGSVLHGNGFINSMWWYCVIMAAFSITQGWFGTIAIAHNCDVVKHPSEQVSTGPLVGICINIGCIIGLFTAMLY